MSGRADEILFTRHRTMRGTWRKHSMLSERRNQKGPKEGKAGRGRTDRGREPWFRRHARRFTTRMRSRWQTPAHDGPGQRTGTLSVDPSSTTSTRLRHAAGRRRDDDTRVGPGLEVDDDEQGKPRRLTTMRQIGSTG